MIDATMIRFLIVGVINTLVGTSTMFLLYNCAGQSYYFSSAANYVIGGICSFFLNKFFTFKAREKKEENLKNKLRNITFQAVKFALTVFISYIISYTLSKKIVSIILVSYSEKIRDNIAMLCGMFCLHMEFTRKPTAKSPIAVCRNPEDGWFMSNIFSVY